MLDGTDVFFNSYKEPIRSILIFLFLFIQTLRTIVNITKVILSCIAFIANSFHIFVLPQKQMRSSSVNVLMIGLAISDMVYFLIDAKYQISRYMPRNNCVPFDSYAWFVFSYATVNLYNIVRRLSPWIGVIMAFTRLLVSSYPFNNTIGKMSNSLFAVWSLLISVLVSILIDFDSYMLYEIRTDFSWVPEKSCGFPKNYSQPVYQVAEKSWTKDFPYVETIFRYTKAVFKYLPTVVLPFTTIGLVKVLKNIRDSKQKLHTNSNDTTYQTTRLVTFMTCCLVITEVSTGLMILPSVLDSAAGSAFSSCAKNVLPCLKLFERKAKTESAPMSLQSMNNRLNGGSVSVVT